MEGIEVTTLILTLTLTVTLTKVRARICPCTDHALSGFDGSVAKANHANPKLNYLPNGELNPDRKKGTKYRCVCNMLCAP